MKRCYLCENSYEESSFYRDKTKNDGLSSRCKSCDSKLAKQYREKSIVAKLSTKRWRENNPNKKKEYNQKLYDKVRQFQNEYKTKNPCDCGESDIDCLDFHHVNQKEMENRIPAIHTFNKTIKEMSKCVVVCANCHRKIHKGKIKCSKKPPTIEELNVMLVELFPEVAKTYKRCKID